MIEPKTIRDARLAIRALEREIDSVRRGPITIQAGFTLAWYLRRAQAALRQAERSLSTADDPRLDPLKPLAPQVEPPQPSLRSRRERYRCVRCMEEALLDEIDLTYDEGIHRRCGGTWEIILPLRRRAKK